MSQLACTRAMQLATRSWAGIDEAEQLRLEHHLGNCGRCAMDASLLEAVVRAARAVGPLDTAARERALQRALRVRGSAPRAATAPVGWRRSFVLFAAACFVTFLGLAVWKLQSPAGAGGGGLRAALGDVLAPEQSAAASAETAYELAGDRTVRLDGATLTALEPSTIVWNVQSATVVVKRGALRFEVVPGRSQPFRVITD